MRSATLLLFPLALLLVGCGGTTVLNANFQNDLYGRPPNITLPGNPEGDALALSGFQVHKIVRWVNTPPGNSSKALEIASDPIGFSGIELQPKTGVPGDRYTLGFTIQTTFMNHRDFLVRARNGRSASNIIAELKFNNGDIFTKTSGPYRPVSGVSYANRDQMTVLLSVDFTQHIFNASIFNGPNNIGTVNNLPITPDVGGSGVYFDMGFEGENQGSGTAGGLPGIIVVDNLNVIKYD